MYSKSAYWPSTVPDSLWQFGLLVPGSRRDFPFVGIAVTGQFVLAFAAGCALICAFAWKRFSEPTYDVNASAFRDFRDLTIWNLKDSFSLRRAYAIYCISLIFIYATLAFFGRVIVQLFDALNVSGLQIGMGTIEFDSWKWPLFLALGISGFAPLINPLVPAENWLRRFSHEVVGIPTRLKEKTIRIKTLIDGAPSDDSRRKASALAQRVLGPKLNSFFALERNLKYVVHWSYEEHVEWSDPEIRRKLNEYERNVRDEAENALTDFQYLTDPARTPDRSTADEDRIKDLEKRLLNNTRLLEDLRDRFSLIMAIYCEYGSRFDKMKPGRLRDSIIEKVVDKREMAATGLPLYGFVIVFVGYFLVIRAQWHPLISSVPLTDQAVAMSAALETAKVFLLVWLPSTVVASFVSVVYGTGLSESPLNKSVAWATISGAIGAFAVAASGMTLVAMLYSALPASNVSQMWQSLFGSGSWTGALLYYLLLTPVAIIAFCFINSVRAPDRPPRFSVILGLASCGALVTLVYLIVFASITVSQPCMVGSPAQPASILKVVSLSGHDLETCFAYYSTLDLIVMPLTVFFSVLGLAPRRLRRSKILGKAQEIAATGVAVLLACAIFLVSSASSAHTREIVIGFRTDIPPFSYLPPPDGNNEKRPYLGYLAELCYEIFDNSDYQLIQVPINGRNRFSAMRQPLPELGDRKVDVLCDAVTVRLDDPERTGAGVFSPIVFVSGVSYLWRSVRRFRDVEVGYLGNSTAERVAKEACTVDALRLGSSGKTPDCFTGQPTECRAEMTAVRSRDPEPTKSLKEIGAAIPAYVLCPMQDHDQLIEWFCSNTDRDKVYFGDREIILGKLAAWRAAGRSCTDVRDPFQSFTYEPYALLIATQDMALFAFVQHRIYELFSHRAGAEALFYKWFPQQTMSEPLAWLFNLNSVMDQEQVISGKKEFPNVKQRHTP